LLYSVNIFQFFRHHHPRLLYVRTFHCRSPVMCVTLHFNSQIGSSLSFFHSCLVFSQRWSRISSDIMISFHWVGSLNHSFIHWLLSLLESLSSSDFHHIMKWCSLFGIIPFEWVSPSLGHHRNLHYWAFENVIWLENSLFRFWREIQGFFMMIIQFVCTRNALLFSHMKAESHSHEKLFRLRYRVLLFSYYVSFSRQRMQCNNGSYKSTYFWCKGSSKQNKS
jgi:hypothetical protein